MKANRLKQKLTNAATAPNAGNSGFDTISLSTLSNVISDDSAFTEESSIASAPRFFDIFKLMPQIAETKF